MSALPIAVQMAEAVSPPIGFIACRVEDAEGGTRRDVAYPFLLVDSQGQMVVAFSAIGPDEALRESIVAAFIDRLER